MPLAAVPSGKDQSRLKTISRPDRGNALALLAGNSFGEHGRDRGPSRIRTITWTAIGSSFIESSVTIRS